MQPCSLTAGDLCLHPTATGCLQPALTSTGRERECFRQRLPRAARAGSDKHPMSLYLPPRRVTRLLGALVLSLGLAPASAVAASGARPVLGRTVAVERVSGTVVVGLPRAAAAVPLVGRRVIPLGSTIDATRGLVRLTTATTAIARTQFGLFDGGAFVVNQQRSGLTDLTLVGGRRRAQCVGSRRDGFAAGVSAAVLRTLHGRAHGRFRTRGAFAAATVRGTDWTTTDRCDGTFVAANHGSVDTESNNGAVSSPTLSSGDSSVYRCAPRGLPPVSSSYCVAVEGFVQHAVLNGRSATLYKYVAALGTKSPAGERTDLCITTPSRSSACIQYPLAPPDPAGFMSSTVGCYTTEPGDYAITYRLGGVPLGAPLIYHSPASSHVSQGCEAWLGKPDPGILGAPLSTELKRVNRYTLPTTALVGFEYIFVRPTGKPGRELIRGIVYADSNGSPGRLLGSTNELSYTSADGSGWAELSFTPNLNLAAGDYWIGLVSGGQPGVADVPYDNAQGVLDYNDNSYSSGASDPFGPITVGNQLMSLYLDYLVAT